ncbi:MAG: response regulator [Desulfobacterales bacterium]|nr:response regulator [Desulfobacterales bacterium]
MPKNEVEKTGRTVVLVNDVRIQLNVLSGHLRGGGFKVLAYDSAGAALAAMSPAAPPDLIVTDLYMPGVDGWRFCRLLRSAEFEAFNHIPILVVSGAFSGDEATRITADLGANAFMPSPVNGKRFTEKARALIRGERPRDRLRILIVEDSKPLSNLLKNAFEAQGLLADAALTAREAADALGEASYDAAVIDYHLPDGKGDALLTDFQKDQPDCVCIMMTTDPNPELALAWMGQGAAAYPRKPF